MGTLQPAKATPMTRAEGVRGIVWALSMRLQELAPDGAILLSTAQWCLETGNGKSCMNYNPAGIKAKAPEGEGWPDPPVTADAWDRTYYPTRERLTTPAAKLWARDKRVTLGPREITPDGGDYTTVRVTPDHPACCFRAYADAEGGFTDYVALLERRFGRAWAALLDPKTTPQGFADVLRAQGYYTDSAVKYGAALTSLVAALRPVLAAYHLSAEAPPEPTETDAERLLYARARAMLATTVLYGPDATTVAWGDAA